LQHDHRTTNVAYSFLERASLSEEETVLFIRDPTL